MSESMEFAGKCIVAVANDPKRMEKTGNILLTQELSKEYNICEDDGSKKLFNILKFSITAQPYHPQIENYVEFVRMINRFRQEIIM